MTDFENLNPFRPSKEVMDALNKPDVVSRNIVQNSPHFHPYTCGNTECRHKSGGAPLLAVEEGWLCELCGYTQKLRS